MGIIRLLLAMSVIIAHIGGGSTWGSAFGLYAAVNSFFIISGFYMALIFTEKYAGKQHSYLLFLTNRFLRIYPIYWLVLLATIILNYYLFYAKSTGYFAIAQHVHQHGSFLYTSFVDIIGDFSLLLRTDYFNINVLHTQPLLIGVAWSLVVELLFYILAPLLVKRRLLVQIGLLVISLGIHYQAVHYVLSKYHIIPQIFFPPYFVFFMFGICSYRLYAYMKKYSYSTKYLLIFFLYITCATVLWDKITLQIPLYKIEFKEWLYSLSLVFSMPAVFLLFSKNKFDRFLGELSYPVYLTHMFFLQAYQNAFGYKTNAMLQLILITLIAIAAAILLVLFVNKPIDNYRQRRPLANSQKLKVSLA